MKKESLAVFDELQKAYPRLEICLEDIIEATEIIIDCCKNGGKVLVCGNGGSAADSLHIVGELMKGFCRKRPLSDIEKNTLSSYGEHGEKLASALQCALPAVSLINESSLSTAFLNDVDPEMGFAQQVLGLAKQGDVLIGISTSGNAKNVHYASITAKARGMKVVSLTGKTGGLMKSISDVTVIAPEQETYKIQELHLPIYHAICRAVEYEFYPV